MNTWKDTMEKSLDVLQDNQESLAFALRQNQYSPPPTLPTMVETRPSGDTTLATTLEPTRTPDDNVAALTRAIVAALDSDRGPKKNQRHQLTTWKQYMNENGIRPLRPFSM